MANHFYVTIRGRNQGQFTGEKLQGAQSNQIAGLAFKYEVALASSGSAKHATGRPEHQAVLLVKKWDAASPQIYSALNSNEAITEVNFEFRKTTANGEEVIYHTIKLTDARIVKVSMHVDAPTPGTPGDTLELEEVSFAFQRIEIDNLEAHTAAVADTWRSVGAATEAVDQAYSRVAAGAPSLAEDKERVAVSVPFLKFGQ